MSDINKSWDDDKILKFVGGIFKNVYGDKLTFENDGFDYLRFYFRGPVPPYHRNAWGRLWIYDDRVMNKIVKILGVDTDVAIDMICFYLSETYDVEIKEGIVRQDVEGSYSSVDDIDYSAYDDEDYHV